MRNLRLVFALLGAAAAGCGSDVSSIRPDAGGELATEERWTEVAVPEGARGKNLHAIAGVGADLVMMVGAQGTALRWVGPVPPPPDPSPPVLQDPTGVEADLHAIHMVSPELGYAVGDAGTILSWDGVQWTAQASPTMAALRGVWADETRVFAVGQDGVAVGRDAMTLAWEVVPLDSPDDLFAIFGHGDEILAVGTLGTVARHRGTGLGRFERRAIRGFQKTLAGATSGPGGSYVVGLDGALFSYDGSFDAIEGLPAVFLRGVAAPGGDLYVVGFDHLVARLRGEEILRYPGIPQRWVYGVYASNDLDVWIVGASGMVLRGPPALDPATVVDEVP